MSRVLAGIALMVALTACSSVDSTGDLTLPDQPPTAETDSSNGSTDSDADDSSFTRPRGGAGEPDLVDLDGGPSEEAAEPPGVGDEIIGRGDLDFVEDPNALPPLDQASALVCAAIELDRNAAIDGDPSQLTVDVAARAGTVGDDELRAAAAEVIATEVLGLEELTAALNRCQELGYETA